MNSSFKPSDVIVVHVGDLGYYSYLDMEKTMFIMNIKAKKKGAGNKLIRILIKHAKEANKVIMGNINPQTIDGMTAERLERWYKIFGGDIFHMVNDPNVIIKRC